MGKSANDRRREYARKHSPHLAVTGTRQDGLCPEYRSWYGMVRRCTNPKSPAYSNYGGRGIGVHGPWLRRDTGGEDGKFSGYTQFVCDMAPRPEGRSLDRKDCNGDYTPENCYWAPVWMEQANVRPVQKLLEKALAAGWSLERLASAMGIDVEKTSQTAKPRHDTAEENS